MPIRNTSKEYSKPRKIVKTPMVSIILATNTMYTLILSIIF